MFVYAMFVMTVFMYMICIYFIYSFLHTEFYIELYEKKHPIKIR